MSPRPVSGPPRPAEWCSDCGKPIEDESWYEAGCGCSWHVACDHPESVRGPFIDPALIQARLDRYVAVAP